ncbi:short-chain dehydrogenase [Alkalilimnicola ehrlichii]|uniref:Short-chain dehydrogenase n=1 Tax=Alkalilimnicola ehrlichii TaxID=351052 RepID=A0A3E0WZV2_9GAMM|nr:SDR family NAD(P)-dependent oxidoreductase [Alkalilimnicola ehrlichii]RFA28983.1 short-chain dehydrogenase [Alkalilimnicola ehrlichii]RFA38619.1 short-chain dehydrogenase [Alkalilimnicola ehrlichii]
MTGWAVVTGGGSGIGRALALELAAKGLSVLIVGRREQALREVQAHAPDAIRLVAADIATEEGRQAVAEALPNKARLQALVHNAGVIAPIGPLSQVTLKDWRQSQAINVEAPLFLTQRLLDRLAGGRVLHVSSGAAHNGYQGWGAYCTSKAALYMLYQVLRDELEDADIAVGSVRPGVVDTPMQDFIREQPAEHFPAVARFISLKQEGLLIPAEKVAIFMRWLLLDVPAGEYSSREWEFNQDASRAGL